MSALLVLAFLSAQQDRQTYSSVLAVLAFSNLYTHLSNPSARRRHMEQMGLPPSHRDLRSRHGSHARLILRRRWRSLP